MAETARSQDCPCYGDTIEHSSDCKNCECEKEAPRKSEATRQLENIASSYRRLGGSSCGL